jgi:hypothetical protein
MRRETEGYELTRMIDPNHLSPKLDTAIEAVRPGSRVHGEIPNPNKKMRILLSR